jgi:hypothetical protein
LRRAFSQRKTANPAKGSSQPVKEVKNEKALGDMDFGIDGETK